jgi:hypothetical protein
MSLTFLKLQILTYQRFNADMRVEREVNKLEFNKQQSHIALSYFDNQIEMKSKAKP